MDTTLTTKTSSKQSDVHMPEPIQFQDNTTFIEGPYNALDVTAKKSSSFFRESAIKSAAMEAKYEIAGKIRLTPYSLYRHTTAFISNAWDTTSTTLSHFASETVSKSCHMLDYVFGDTARAVKKTTIDTFMSLTAEYRSKKPMRKSLSFMNKVFYKTGKKIQTDPVCSREKKIDRLKKMFLPYEETIEQAVPLVEKYYEQTDADAIHFFEMREYYRNLKAYSPDMTDEQKTELYTLLNIEKPVLEEVAGADIDVLIKEKAFSRDGRIYHEKTDEEKQQAEERKKDLDASLSAQHIEEIKRIDRWLLNRSDYSQANKAFIFKIMQLSMRERLFIYNSICMGTEMNSDAISFRYTQTGPLPNVSVFRSNMHTSKFWKHIIHHGIFWNKLEAAYQRLDEAQPEIERFSFSAFAESTYEERESHMLQIDQETTAREVMKTDEYKALESERNQCFRSMFDDMQNALASRASVNGSSIIPKFVRKFTYKNNIASFDNSRKKFLASEIKFKTFVYKEREKRMGSTGDKTPQELDEAWARLDWPFYEEDALWSLTDLQYDALITSPDLYLPAIGQLLNRTSNIAEWNASTDQKLLDSLVQGANQTVKKGKLAFSATRTIAKGINKAPSLFLQDSADITIPGVTEFSNVAPYISMGANVTRFVAKSVDLGLTVHRQNQVFDSYDEMKQLNLDSRESEYASDILSLTVKNASQRVVNDGIDLCSATINIAATALGLLVPGAGTLISTSTFAINAAVTLGTKVGNYFYNLHKQKASVDDFLKTDDLSDIVDYEHIDDKKKKSLENPEVKERLRDEMVAELGYNNFRTFFYHVVEKMAEFIYNKLFFRDNGRQIAPGETDAQYEVFSKFCCGLGLTVQVGADGLLNKPCKEAIMQKLI